MSCTKLSNGLQLLSRNSTSRALSSSVVNSWRNYSNSRSDLETSTHTGQVHPTIGLLRKHYTHFLLRFYIHLIKYCIFIIRFLTKMIIAMFDSLMPNAMLMKIGVLNWSMKYLQLKLQIVLFIVMVVMQTWVILKFT